MQEAFPGGDNYDSDEDNKNDKQSEEMQELRRK